MSFWTAAPMTVQGPRKGEPSSRSMRNRLRPQPARLVRGSSRRIMSMRSRPAYIRVINRRASSSTVIGPAVHTKLLQAHQQERVPATPPVETPASATTVLAGKGSLRRAKLRRALASSAPLWRAILCDGRLRREHFTVSLLRKRKDRLPSWRRKAGLASRINLSAFVGLDRSLHIRTSSDLGQSVNDSLGRNDDQLTPLRGMQNAWCITASIGHKPVLLNVIATLRSN